MNPLDIIYDHYPPGAPLTDIVVRHSGQVRDMSLDIARRCADLKPDLAFIAEAAMLHDIGICRTDSPAIECRGSSPYVCHGIIGRQMLQPYGLHDHGLVCERHVGAGISREEIRQQQLPLPRRDMLPVTVEEQIICYADSFFSKTDLNGPHSLARVKTDHARHAAGQLERFMQWHALFAR